MNILITGHKGFVGAHFIRRLHKDHNIVGVDIKDGNDCRDLFKKDTTRYDLVIHLAAIIGGRQTIEGQPIAVASDLAIDADMFNWAVRTKQRKIVYYSSSAAYPVALQTHSLKHKLVEDDISYEDLRKPDLTYGFSKLSGEILASYARREGVNVHVFRPFSGYGPLQDLDYPFPSFIKRINNKVKEFIIWGDGEQVRDFIYIEDIVSATLKAVDEEIYGPVNLGNGIPISFNQLAKMMFKISGHHPDKIVHMLDAPKGVEYRCSNNKLMLSFYPPLTPIEDVIARCV